MRLYRYLVSRFKDEIEAEELLPPRGGRLRNSLFPFGSCSSDEGDASAAGAD